MSEVTVKGIYRDRLFDSRGDEIFDSGWKSNLIVTRCRILLGSFMHNESSAKGIQALRVGQGDPLWDTSPIPPPDPGLDKLVDPAPFIIPLESLGIQYLNDSDDVVSDQKTSRIQIVATLGPNQPIAGTYKLREFGLFGELNEEPWMIDYIRHPLIEKSGSVTLERRIRLIF
ncbi:MAG TPA: hypothetical protein VFV34_16165 [Blastocatellia bacterium]|nr:hypothetical protein [Blastocatellia bacterium]